MTTMAADRASTADGYWAARMVRTADRGSYILVTRKGFVYGQFAGPKALAAGVPESVRRELLAALEGA